MQPPLTIIGIVIRVRVVAIAEEAFVEAEEDQYRPHRSLYSSSSRVGSKPGEGLRY